MMLNLPVLLRPVQTEDVPRLEWFGLMTPFRQVLENDYARSENGECIYLVADVNNFPVAQVVADMDRYQKEGIGLVTALRVIPPFRRLGIAQMLLTAVEDIFRQKGCVAVQLNVAKDNAAARRLYKKAGYRIIGEKHEPWHYTTPDGSQKTVDEMEWVMEKMLGEDRSL